MPLLLIEDDLDEITRFVDCSNSRNDIKFVGMTDSSVDAMKMLKTHLPEGVIVDIQLIAGEGSGLDLIDTILSSDLAFRPVIVVTTSSRSHLLLDQVQKLGVDYIFSKHQKGYSADYVIKIMLKLRGSLHSKQKTGASDRRSIESPAERRAMIDQRITVELDYVGIKHRMVGREYLHEAIALQIESGPKAGSKLYRVADLKRKSYASILRGIQTAIDHAWSNAKISDLQKYYTARVSEKTGTPTASDFIHYYADKIRRTL
jgi:ActR/RegA family two-component response regulator